MGIKYFIDWVNKYIWLHKSDHFLQIICKVCLSTDHWTLIIIPQWLKIGICVSCITFDTGQNILCLQIMWLSELPWIRQRPSFCQIFIACHISVIIAFRVVIENLIQRGGLFFFFLFGCLFVFWLGKTKLEDTVLKPFFSPTVATNNVIVKCYTLSWLSHST